MCACAYIICVSHFCSIYHFPLFCVASFCCKIMMFLCCDNNTSVVLHYDNNTHYIAQYKAFEYKIGRLFHLFLYGKKVFIWIFVLHLFWIIISIIQSKPFTAYSYLRCKELEIHLVIPFCLFGTNYWNVFHFINLLLNSKILQCTIKKITI